eukprot:scaffold732_cov48-Attheya_sp.AAC.5
MQVVGRCIFHTGERSNGSVPTLRHTRPEAIVKESLVTKEALSHEEACGLSESMFDDEMYTSHSDQNSDETGETEVANADIENCQDESPDAAIRIEIHNSLDSMDSAIEPNELMASNQRAFKLRMKLVGLRI